MRKIIIDTNILIDYINGYASWLDNLIELKNDFTLITPTIVIAEYFVTQEIETKLGKKKSEEYLSWFTKQDLTEEIAKILGTILRRKTHPPGAGLADLIIAATTIYLNAELATRNKTHFSKIPNLRFFKPKSR